MGLTILRTVAAFLGAIGIASVAFAETITASAAVSLRDALTQVAASYKTATGDDVQFTFGASGQLANQIQGGAPVDLFISAANKQVDDLIKSGSAIPESRKIIAGNSLVVITPADAKSKPASLKDLADAAFARIAMGEPKTVPAGQYAEQSLKRAEVYDVVKNKLVFASNVRQVLDYVERGEVSAGLVYGTDARISGDKVKVAFTVNESDHDPIVYPAVIVTASKKQEAAAKFLTYLQSADAQTKLQSFGFTPPEEKK